MPRQNRPQSACDDKGDVRSDAPDAPDALQEVVPTPELEAETPPAPAPSSLRFVAMVRIHAGHTYVPGDEIPESLALDGLSEGVHWHHG